MILIQVSSISVPQQSRRQIDLTDLFHEILGKKEFKTRSRSRNKKNHISAMIHCISKVTIRRTRPTINQLINLNHKLEEYNGLCLKKLKRISNYLPIGILSRILPPKFHKLKILYLKKCPLSKLEALVNLLLKVLKSYHRDRC